MCICKYSWFKAVNFVLVVYPSYVPNCAWSGLCITRKLWWPPNQVWYSWNGAGRQTEEDRWDEDGNLLEGKGTRNHFCFPGSGTNDCMACCASSHFFKLLAIAIIIYYYVFLCTYRQRYIPRISTQNEQRGRRFTRRKSVWQISWSIWRNSTHSFRMRWSLLEGTS